MKRKDRNCFEILSDQEEAAAALTNFLTPLTEGKSRHWWEQYHFVVSTLALGLKINFGQPIEWMEFQRLAEIKWLPFNL